MKIQLLMLVTACVAMGCIGAGFKRPENSNSESSSRGLLNACKGINRGLLQKDIDRFSGLKRTPIERWHIHDISTNQGACIVLLSELNGEILGSAIDVVVYDPMNKKLITVKDFLGNKIPKTLRAKIGAESGGGRNSIGYFAEFTGDSVVNIFKIILSQYPKSNSFEACILNNKKQTNGGASYSPTGKLDWDPTPNRRWRVESAEFLTEIAARNEVDDIYADQLDDDFNGFIEGSLSCNKPRSERGHVGPWGGFLDQVFLDGKWTSVEYSSAYPDIRVPKDQNEPKFNYEVRVTQGANFSSCLAFLETNPQIKEKAIIKVGAPGMEEPFAVSILIAPPVDGVLAQIKAQSTCFDLINKL